MNDQAMLAGFSPDQQAKYEQYLIARYGEGAKKSIEESKKRVRCWTAAEWQKSGQVFAEICRDLTRLMAAGLHEDSPDVQAVIRRHHEWLTQFWTPTRESYAGHSALIEDSELRKAYEAHHLDLPKFMASAMRLFAERELD